MQLTMKPESRVGFEKSEMQWSARYIPSEPTGNDSLQDLFIRLEATVIPRLVVSVDRQRRSHEVVIRTLDDATVPLHIVSSRPAGESLPPVNVAVTEYEDAPLRLVEASHSEDNGVHINEFSYEFRLADAEELRSQLASGSASVTFEVHQGSSYSSSFPIRLRHEKGISLSPTSVIVRRGGESVDATVTLRSPQAFRIINVAPGDKSVEVTFDGKTLSKEQTIAVRAVEFSAKEEAASDWPLNVHRVDVNVEVEHPNSKKLVIPVFVIGDSDLGSHLGLEPVH